MPFRRRGFYVARPRRYRRYLARKRGRARFRKKYVRGAGRLTVYKPIKSRVAPWTRSAYTTMDYTSTFLLRVGAVGDLTNWATYRANSIYDPLSAIGGESPWGKPEWAAMYAKYRVVGVKVTAYYTGDVDVNGGCLAFVGMIDSSQVTTMAVSLGAEQIIRQRNFAWTHCNNIDGRGTSTVKKYASIANIEGRNIKGESDYESTMGANPTKVPQILVGVSAWRSQQEANYDVLLKIRYYVQLFDRALPSTATVPD